jgi:CBS domain-containing protein
MDYERNLPATGVMSLELQPPLVLEISCCVAKVIREMQQGGHGCALITKNQQLAGIFTERNVLLAVLGNDAVLTLPISTQMTAAPVCVGTTDTIRQVLMLMYEGGYRHIPIVDATGQVAGCVRHKDIAEYLVNHFAEYVLNLPPNPEQIAQKPEGG